MQPVVIKPDRINTLSIQMTIAKGGLAVTSTPPDGRIFLNEKPLGATPMSINNLAAGRYTVRVTHPDCADFYDSVNIEADRATRLHAVLSPPNELFVESVPLGAEVFLDNRPAGKTPCILPGLRDGTYAVRVSRESFRAWNDSVAVRGGGQTSVRAELVPIFGRLSVISDPPGAQVWLNNALHGTTPCVIERLAFAAYQVQVAAIGCDTVERRVVIDAEKTVSLSLDLPRSQSRLAVLSNVPGADLSLDGEYIGATPVDGAPLTPGPHRLVVSKPGYETVVRTFHLAPHVLRHQVVVELAARTPARSLARSLVLPGWGQYYAGHTEKALLAAVAEAGCLVLTGWYLYSHDHLQNDYSQALTAYRTAMTNDAIAAARAQTSSRYDALRRNSRNANISAALAAGVWLLNLADAYWLSPADKGRENEFLSGQETRARFYASIKTLRIECCTAF
jgi:hypothetical protein